MPEISRFYGVIIAIYYYDHPPAHFHVKYNEYHAILSIRELKIIDGKLPKRVLAMALEWAFEYRFELNANWNLAAKGLPLKKIKPLE